MTNYDIYKENYEAIKEIVKEFSRSDAQEIISRIFCGESVDSSIQSVVCNEE